MARTQTSFGSRFPLTAALLIVNGVIFVSMAVKTGSSHFDGYTLIRFGALQRLLIWEGEHWRLISYAFLHANIFHVGMNCYFLYQLGPILELKLGVSRCATLYLVSALGAGVLTAVIYRDGPTVGASGALCGLVGGLTAWGAVQYRDLQRFFRMPEGSWVPRFVVIMVLLGLLWEGIDNWAHLGGGLTGWAVGQVLARDQARRWDVQWHRVVMYSLIVTVLLAGWLYARYSIWTPQYRQYRRYRPRAAVTTREEGRGLTRMNADLREKIRVNRRQKSDE